MQTAVVLFHFDLYTLLLGTVLREAAALISPEYVSKFSHQRPNSDRMSGFRLGGILARWSDLALAARIDV